MTWDQRGTEMVSSAVTPPRPPMPPPPPGRYGDVVVMKVANRDEPLVERADSPALCSVELLRELPAARFIAPDFIWIGTTAAGATVHYRIYGWEPHERALIIYREVVDTR